MICRIILHIMDVLPFGQGKNLSKVVGDGDQRNQKTEIIRVQ